MLGIWWKIGLSSILVIITGILFTSTYAENDYSIPDWVKNTAGWWSEGSISDSDFIQAIQFLIDNNILETKAKQFSSNEEYNNRIIELELENAELKNRISDLEYRYAKESITYSIDETPIYADKQIIKDAVSQAFHNWERLNPNLDYIQVQSNGDMKIEFWKNPIVDNDNLILGTVDTIGCFDNCVITLALGDKDCDARWSQFTVESLQEVMMHEIGHTIGLEHTAFYPHLMYSPVGISQPDDLGYLIPKNIQEDFIVINKQHLFKQIEDIREKIDELLSPYGVTLDEYHSGQKIPSSSRFYMEADQKVNPLIEEYNNLVNEINCYTVHNQGVD